MYEPSQGGILRALSRYMVFFLKLVLGSLALVVLFVVAANWTPDRSVESLKARWAKPPSQFISLGGMEVHLRDEGPREDPSPIVLLHGSGASLQTWDGCASLLKNDHRVIRLDRPGFGLTGPNPSGDYSMAFNTKFTKDFLDRMQIRHCTLVGNSSGGRVAWQVAAAYPERVDHLVLLAAGGYPRTTPLPLGLKIASSPILGPVLQHILPRSSVERGLRSSYGDPSKVTSDLVTRNYDLTLRKGNRKALGQSLRQQVLDRGDATLIRTIRAPTLIVWGDRDTTVPPHDASRFHADIKNSQVVFLRGVGHLSQEEDPGGTVAALTQFLKH
jgi:pimeloyl-ACP methyl ester carboxylesterase